MKQKKNEWIHILKIPKHKFCHKTYEIQLMGTLVFRGRQSPARLSLRTLGWTWRPWHGGFSGRRGDFSCHKS